MSYREFTWGQAKQAFGLRTVEGDRFLPDNLAREPSAWLRETLARTIPWAIAVGNEKARSEGIITPVLLEVKAVLAGEISVFSGEELNVAPDIGLNGTCDFVLSQSAEQLALEAPVVVVVEAKRDDLKRGMGQCLATLVAAERFNQQRGQAIAALYGCVTTGTVWRFLCLRDQTVSVDLQDYPLPPIAPILGALVWMASPPATGCNHEIESGLTPG